MFFGGVTMLASGAWIGYIVWIGNGDIDGSLGLQLFLALVAVVMFGAGIAGTLFTIRYRVYLVGNTLRMRHIWGYREIRHEELRGFRITASTPSTLHLIPKNKTARKLDVTLCFKDSDDLWTWLGDLPDLNIEDQLGAEDRVLDNPAFGETEERRWKALNDARRAAKYLNGFVGLIAALALFYPEPYEALMLVLIAAPWLGAEIVRRYSGLIRLDERPNDAHPSIAVSLICSSMLGVRALDWQVIDWPRALLWGSLVASAALFLLLHLDASTRKHRLSVLFLFLFFVSYGYGAIVMVNCLWDDQDAEIVEAEVIGKRVSGSSSSPDSYLLELKPWGPFIDAEEFEVSRSLHQDIETGELVCLAVRPGSLRISWFTLRRCQSS